MSYQSIKLCVCFLNWKACLKKYLYLLENGGVFPLCLFEDTGTWGNPDWGSCIPNRLIGCMLLSMYLVSDAFFCCSCFCMFAVRMPIFFTLSYRVREGTPYFLLAWRAEQPEFKLAISCQFFQSTAFSFGSSPCCFLTNFQCYTYQLSLPQWLPEYHPWCIACIFSIQLYQRHW